MLITKIQKSLCIWCVAAVAFTARASTTCVELSDQDAANNVSPSQTSKIPADYVNANLTRLVPENTSKAELVQSPFDGRWVKPERHLYLKVGDHNVKQGDIAVAHDIINGQIVRREALMAEFVESAGRYRLKIVLELYDKNGEKIIDPALLKKEKSKCFRCHSVDRNVGHLLMTDEITTKPISGSFVFTSYADRPESERLHEAERAIQPN